MRAAGSRSGHAQLSRLLPRARGFRVAFYQARPDSLAIYRALNLHVFKMGEEAMLFPQTFTLQGSALAKVRTRCRHAEREGVQIQWYEGILPATVMQQLACVSEAWLESKGDRHTEETGFRCAHGLKAEQTMKIWWQGPP